MIHEPTLTTPEGLKRDVLLTSGPPAQPGTPSARDVKVTVQQPIRDTQTSDPADTNIFARCFVAVMRSRASASVVLIRLYVGAIFVGEGILKFSRPGALGSGRFTKLGIPWGAAIAQLDGGAEIVCGLLILVGLLVRLAAVPMIIDMLGALALTKVPLWWGSAILYPHEKGIGDLFHEGRLEIAMLCGCLYLLTVGAGTLSLDARWTHRRSGDVR